MDWFSGVVGAFAGAGLIGLFLWLQRLLGPSKPVDTATPPAKASEAAVEAVTAVLVAEAEEEENKVRDALADRDTAADTLADMLNDRGDP